MKTTELAVNIDGGEDAMDITELKGVVTLDGWEVKGVKTDRKLKVACILAYREGRYRVVVFREDGDFVKSTSFPLSRVQDLRVAKEYLSHRFVLAKTAAELSRKEMARHLGTRHRRWTVPRAYPP